MDTATLATALAVMQEGSVRGAGRLLGRPASSVADAFERFEAALAMKLAMRGEGALSLTVAGHTLARSCSTFLDILGAMAAIATPNAADTALSPLVWAARNAMSMASLSHFNSVVQAGSIRRAARQLDVGQPNLSRQMSHLEKVFGCELLLRANDGCEPSANGMAFNEAALALVRAVGALTAPANRRFAQEVRTIRLGTIIPIGHESRVSARLAQLVATWQADEGRPDLLVSSTTAEDLMEGMKSGRFDVALMDTAMRHKRFESREVFSSELVLVALSALMASAPSARALIGAHRIAVPSIRSGLRQQIDDALHPLVGNDVDAPAKLVEVDALSIILNLVLDHGYLSVLPIDAVASLSRQVCVIRLAGAPQVGFHLVWQRTQAARKIALQIAESLTSPQELPSSAVDAGKVEDLLEVRPEGHHRR